MIKGLTALDMLTQPAAEKLVKNQEQINQLHDVLSTVRLDKQNALVRRLVRKSQDGTLGQVAPETADTGEDSDVTEETEKVNFGDVTNTYHIAEGAKEGVATKAPSLLPYVLAAALGGTGLGAAAMALPALLRPSATASAADSDTDTTLNLEFTEGDEK